MKRLILILVSTVILSGCIMGRAVRIKDIKPFPVRTQTCTYKISANYKIQEVKTSNIGSAMIAVEDFIVKEKANYSSDWHNKPAFKAAYNFELIGDFQTTESSSKEIRTC